MANAVNGENRKGNVTEEGWSNAFASQDSKKFEEMFTEDVVLVSATQAKPIVGRKAVGFTFGAASSYYVHCNFISQATCESPYDKDGTRTFLEWELLTHHGMNMEGCTIFDRNKEGKIFRAAIHHRPLGEGLLFSNHLRESTKEVVSEDTWWTPDLFEKKCAQYPDYPYNK